VVFKEVDDVEVLADAVVVVVVVVLVVVVVE